MRLLLVEDDAMLGAAVQTGLQQEGYAVDWVRDGAAAQAALRKERFDLVVLDLGLPAISGIDVLRYARSIGMTAPVLILTARDAVADRVAGLDAGGDDYLTKPFDLEELAARLRALLRRASGRSDNVIQYGDLVLNPVAWTVHLAGEPVDLSSKEFSLLHLLLQNMGKVLSRERMEKGLYGWQSDIDSNTIEVHVHHLRRKLRREYIVTVRGVGYMIPLQVPRPTP
ncbi:response regulator [Extensimonas vulgaris]|uniref:Two-component system response regulator QseB n=1 Tax=Extensimonas vulgaris TaxID=1031594 RepID=A0A369ATE6_9BURK|nr:response regulator [Extensimonas vulgaris]RCX11507.1 two-component system response regulator QseB [Extensimonas vulgaris]TWI40404.1 two-component system response regulator QseB [Extensimonas vulgaris]TXD16429.1 response regulator [Extensimonas vulgaris]